MTVRMTSEAFYWAIPKLLKDRQMSQRELIRITRRQNRWGSNGAMTNILQNERAPTTQAMEVIAQALQIRPEYFPEYRLAKARSCLDPDVVGVKAALNGIEAARRALDGE